MKKDTIRLLYDKLERKGYNFFVGVPDSVLKDFIQEIPDDKNIIAAHESQALAIAFGAELTGKKTCVYLQNSGLGNLVNPITSLCTPSGIFPLLVIGHREGLEQHKEMGRIDEPLLKLLNYPKVIMVHDKSVTVLGEW